MSDNPAYPDADKTAPGGMSLKALAVELIREHGFTPEQVDSMKWPARIDACVKGRAKQEAEQAVYADPQDEDLHDAAQEGDDLDALIAEAFDGEPVAVIEELAHDAKAGLFIGMPGTKDFIFDGHRGAGPSGAERWMACTASLGAARQFLETLTPNQQREFASGNMAARQGTTAHAVAETQARVLLGEVTPEEADTTLLELTIMPETEGEAYDEEMEGYVSEYVDLVKTYVDEGREVLIEHTVTATIPLLTATDGVEDTYDIMGSLDLGVVPSPDHPVLVVGDLKYGEGIDVDVEQNPQIRIYALGILADIIERYACLPEWLQDVEYIIVQPRLGGIKRWTETVDDLLDWQDNVLSKALTEALGGERAGAAFVPGPVQCQWCPVRGSCPALTEQRVAEAADLFDEIVEGFPETSLLSDERLAALYSQAKGIADIVGDLKDEAQRRLHRGQAIPGFQLVSYTPPRRWKEQAAEELDPGNGTQGLLHEDLAAALWTRKLMTPTQALKLLPEDQAALIEDLIDVPDKRPVIAPDGDRRKPWTGTPPEQMFDIIEED